MINTENEKVKMEAAKGNLQKIREIPEPRFKDDVASFMCLVKTLNSWTGATSSKTDVVIKWDLPHHMLFLEMKKHLEEVCQVNTYDKLLSLDMFSDTGGLGYVLIQKKEDNRYNIIYTGSTGLKDRQKIGQ